MMGGATTTTTITETITAHSGAAFARIEIFNGKPTGGRLIIDTGGRGTNQLLIKNLQQLKDVVLAAQELLEAVAERTG
jgi:hypothetical protein